MLKVQVGIYCETKKVKEMFEIKGDYRDRGPKWEPILDLTMDRENAIRDITS